MSPSTWLKIHLLDKKIFSSHEKQKPLKHSQSAYFVPARSDLFIVYPTGGLQCLMNLIQFSLKVQSQPTARLSRKQPIDPYALSNSRLTTTYLKLEHVKQNATIWQLFSTLFSMLIQMGFSLLLSVLLIKTSYLRDTAWLRLSVESNFTCLRVWYSMDGNSEKCSLFSY